MIPCEQNAEQKPTGDVCPEFDEGEAQYGCGFFPNALVGGWLDDVLATTDSPASRRGNQQRTRRAVGNQILNDAG